MLTLFSDVRWNLVNVPPHKFQAFFPYKIFPIFSILSYVQGVFIVIFFSHYCKWFPSMVVLGKALPFFFFFYQFLLLLGVMQFTGTTIFPVKKLWKLSQFIYSVQLCHASFSCYRKRCRILLKNLKQLSVSTTFKYVKQSIYS